MAVNMTSFLVAMKVVVSSYPARNAVDYPMYPEDHEDNMAYTVRNMGGIRPWKVVKTEDNKIVGTSTSREKALKTCEDFAKKLGSERRGYR